MRPLINDKKLNAAHCHNSHVIIIENVFRFFLNVEKIAKVLIQINVSVNNY